MTVQSSVTGKVCIVTGAGFGMGLTISQMFTERGAKVMMVDSKDHPVQEEAAKIGALACVVDYGSREDLKQMVQKTERAFGRIDVLINCANLQIVAPIEEFAEDNWDLMQNLLLTVPFLITKYVWPIMQKQRFGRIINFNSIHGLVASENKVAYVSAKHGLGGLTKAAAVEGGKYGITVNSLCPAYVHTPAVEKQAQDLADNLGCSFKEALEDHLLAKAAIKTLVPQSSVVDALCFLCSDAAAQISGSMFTMDGAYSAS